MNINLKFRDTQISQMSALEGCNARPAYILAMLAERKGDFLKGLGAAAQEAFDSIFPPAHRHPQRLPHEWQTGTELDPVLRPLVDKEHGCGPATECKLVMSFEQHVPARITIN